MHVEPAVPTVRFVEFPLAALTALLADDLDAASANAGVALPPSFLTARAKWVWQRRLGQLRDEPGIEAWLTRAAVSGLGVVIGYGGFHAPPDSTGMVELGYTVDPGHRRQGYARAMLTELLREAAAAPGAATVRVTISPDNAPSLATIAGFGFASVGEQWDDVDGLELIFEIPAE